MKRPEGGKGFVHPRLPKNPSMHAAIYIYTIFVWNKIDILYIYTHTHIQWNLLKKRFKL